MARGDCRRCCGGASGPVPPLLVTEQAFDVTGNVVAGSPLAYFDLSTVTVDAGWRGKVLVDLTGVGSNTMNSPGSVAGDLICALHWSGTVWNFSSTPSARYSALGGVTSPGFSQTSGNSLLRWTNSNSSMRLFGVVRIIGTADIPPYTPP